MVGWSNRKQVESRGIASSLYQVNLVQSVDWRQWSWQENRLSVSGIMAVDSWVDQVVSGVKQEGTGGMDDPGNELVAKSGIPGKESGVKSGVPGK